MAKIRIASAAALALFAATAANAADIARPVYKAPVMVPVVYNWSGFYLGGFAGAAFGGNSSAVDLDGWNATGTQWSYELGNSFIGGGTIGFNWQAPGSAWVFGLEGEFGYLQLKGSAPDPISPTDTFASTKIGNWYGFAGARVGYAWDRTLLYAKGGAAFVDSSTGTVDACASGPCGGGLIDATASKTISTWAIGGGIEWAWVNNWTFKVEYLYIDLDKSYNVCGVPRGGGSFCWQHDVESVHTVKAGLNYKFDWGKTPVMAKY